MDKEDAQADLHLSCLDKHKADFLMWRLIISFIRCFSSLFLWSAFKNSH